MKDLAPQKYWDSVYKHMAVGSSESVRLNSWREKLKVWTRDYSNFLIWEAVLPKVLLVDDKLKIIEIGSAPGKYLINFNKLFHYQVYGIEYSEGGAAIAKENFITNGLDPNNIIKADFFSQDFQNQFKEHFDLVFSRGFIEHYHDVESVVNQHLNLVKTGGRIVISIPNLSGVNYTLSKYFNIDSLLLHNTTIMNKASFSNLFPVSKVESIFCDYVGLFSFGLFNTNRRWKYIIYRILLLIQRPVDLVLRLIWPSNFLKSRFTSPYLLFVGIKK